MTLSAIYKDPNTGKETTVELEPDEWRELKKSPRGPHLRIDEAGTRALTKEPAPKEGAFGTGAASGLTPGEKSSLALQGATLGLPSALSDDWNKYIESTREKGGMASIPYEMAGGALTGRAVGAGMGAAARGAMGGVGAGLAAASPRAANALRMLGQRASGLERTKALLRGASQGAAEGGLQAAAEGKDVAGSAGVGALVGGGVSVPNALRAGGRASYAEDISNMRRLEAQLAATKTQTSPETKAIRDQISAIEDRLAANKEAQILARKPGASNRASRQRMLERKAEEIEKAHSELARRKIATQAEQALKMKKLGMDPAEAFEKFEAPVMRAEGEQAAAKAAADQKRAQLKSIGGGSVTAEDVYGPATDPGRGTRQAREAAKRSKAQADSERLRGEIESVEDYNRQVQEILKEKGRLESKGRQARRLMDRNRKIASESGRPVDTTDLEISAVRLSREKAKLAQQLKTASASERAWLDNEIRKVDEALTSVRNKVLARRRMGIAGAESGRESFKVPGLPVHAGRASKIFKPIEPMTPIDQMVDESLLMKGLGHGTPSAVGAVRPGIKKEEER